MANDTKERILAAALEMFSQNGYAGTNIRELSCITWACQVRGL